MADVTRHRMGEAMREEHMTFNTTLAVERITTGVEMQSCHDFMEEAALAIAKKLLASGCLVHHSEYDILNQYTRESITLLVAKRERKLP